MEGLPRDLHELLFRKHLDWKSAIRLAAASKKLRTVYESIRQREDDCHRRFLQCERERANVLRIACEKSNVRDREKNVLPLDRWTVCRDCDVIYTHRKIASHQCQKTVLRCEKCDEPIRYGQDTCDFDIIECPLFSHSDKEAKCRYRDFRYKVQKHMREDLHFKLGHEALFGCSLNILSLMAGMRGLRYSN